jgi:nickel transport protein
LAASLREVDPCRSAFNPVQDRYLLGMSRPAVPITGHELLARWRRIAAAMFLVVSAGVCSVPTSPAHAFDLFATHEVTAQFATPDGKPMANAEVRVFAPDDPSKVALTGSTNAEGKFVFDADRDGFWSTEARSSDYVARVMIRVGGEAEPHSGPSPFLIIGVLVVLLGLAIWYRLLRARARGPRP